MEMNLREAVHMVNLRTMPQGHLDYRFICQKMWRNPGSSSDASRSGKILGPAEDRLGPAAVRDGYPK